MITVVVCDDHVVFAESLAELLTVAGIHVADVAAHPDQAIAVIQETPVDVCLLDVMFGRESVLPRLAEFRRLAPSTRVLLLTGRLDADVLTAARQGCASGVATKRLLGDEIVAMLQRVCAGERIFTGAAVPSIGSRARPGQDGSDGAAPGAGDHAQRLARFLTPRERETLRALVRGHDSRRLARILGVAPATARCHIQRVLTKMGAHSRLEAATSAVRFGIINPETGDWLLPDS